jgi:predicted membrane protein
MTRVDIAEIKALMMFLVLAVVKNYNSTSLTYTVGAISVAYSLMWCYEVYKTKRRPSVKKPMKVR